MPVLQDLQLLSFQARGHLFACVSCLYGLQVKLNKRQLEMLGCSDGALAARFAKQLVTIVTDLKHPPVR